EQVGGVEPAPRIVGGVAAPSEIAAGVPGDLDALCRMTLNEDTGPLTPGDFASQIAPWSREAVHRVEVAPTVVLELPRPDSGSTDASTADAKVGSFARAATDKAAAALGDTDLGGERMTLPEALSAHYDEIEPPLPMLPASTAQAPSHDQSKLVVIIVATFVTLSLIVGYFGLQSIGQGVKQPGAAPRGTVTVNVPPVTAGPSAPDATQAGPPGGQPFAILSATGFDPQGDRTENNAQAPRVYDGNPATSWSSEGYNSPAFGGLKKGVGVLLDLGQPTSVNQVAIDLAKGPVDLTVYAATTPGLDGATVIGSATAASGHVELKAASTMPRAQYVIVWFTKLAPDAPWFRASISEIVLS
ncbi:MAG TPA: discoidin domain-containing protein, partial [Dermatophilaceae bacterium]